MTATPPPNRRTFLRASGIAMALPALEALAAAAPPESPRRMLAINLYLGLHGLTAAPHPGSSSFRNTISLDHVAAEKLGAETRFSYLALSSGGAGLSWSRSGVQIPAESSPARLFARLFLRGDARAVATRVQKL